MSSSAIEKVVSRDTWVVAGAVLLVVALSAVYTVGGVGMSMSAIEMTRMAGPVGEPMAMGPGMSWTLVYAVLVFLMWWVMMIAMMTPSAAPTLLLFTALKRHGSEKDHAATLSLLFLTGYLLVWGGFSAIATGAQWATELIGMVDGPMMTMSSKAAAGALLVLAGLFQFSSLKAACLKQCSSPAQFLTQHRRKGRIGALLMGMHHGVFCLGWFYAFMSIGYLTGAVE